jgi:sigma-E factor negative regulatory protein RseB
VSPSRTVVVGSAVPLLLLIVLVGLPPARAAVGLQQSEPDPLGGMNAPVADPSANGTGAGVTAADEARSLAWLRRSISAGHDLVFTGTEVVSIRHPGSSTTRVLELQQGGDGVRTATAQAPGTPSGTAPSAGTGSRQLVGPGADGDALAGLSERALDALAAGYDLRTDGADRVAGRAATVVVAERDGREVARMWLDDRTGLLLRQDVRDGAGQLHRTATFLDLVVTGTRTVAPSVGPLRSSVKSFGVGSLTIPAVRRSDRAATPAPASTGPWRDVVSPTELTTLRAEGWPCPVALAAGYVLLDARRTASSSGPSTLHLTYGDGLSAISVFLQRGELNAAGLTGLTSRKWGDTEVYVRDGWPEVMVWQGGPTVITAVGDAEPADLQTILSALPRQSNRGTLGSLQQRMGSALAWFKS